MEDMSSNLTPEALARVLYEGYWQEGGRWIGAAKAALAALTPAPAKGARCKHGYPMTCPHYDCRPTPPPPEPEGEVVEALTRVRDCAKGIMPIHKDMDSLRTTIIGLHDARWTRLFAIYFEADAALARARGKG